MGGGILTLKVMLFNAMLKNKQTKKTLEVILFKWNLFHALGKARAMSIHVLGRTTIMIFMH